MSLTLTSDSTKKDTDRRLPPSVLHVPVLFDGRELLTHSFSYTDP